MVDPMKVGSGEVALSEAELLEGLARLWRGYARKVYGPDYPLYQAMATAVAEDHDVLQMILDCRPEAHDPNMLLAALQYLVLGGSDHPLARLYRPGWDGEPLGPLLHDFCHDHCQTLVSLMNSRHIQTNETGRCGGIARGLAAAADRIGEPLALVDDGASAGLNLCLDEYLLDFGPDGHIGPLDSPVRLPCELRGPRRPPAIRLPRITRRLGIDRAPVDLRDPDTVRWMLACIWPGTGRQARVEAAMAIQAGRPGLVRRGDMVDDLPAVLGEMGHQPVAVVTSWSYSYLPLTARDDFVRVLAARAAAVPVAWVCCDLLGTVDMFDPGVAPSETGSTPSVLGLAVFAGGEIRSEALAFMHSHGQWIEWLSGK